MPDPTVSIDEITTKSTIRRKVKQHQVKIVMQTDATKKRKQAYYMYSISQRCNNRQ